MNDQSSTAQVVDQFGISSITMIMQLTILSSFIALWIWSIVSVLKITKGAESALWVAFLVFLPFLGLPVAYFHFKEARRNMRNAKFQRKKRITDELNYKANQSC